MVELSRETDHQNFIHTLKALAIAHNAAGDRESEIKVHDEAISVCREKDLKAELAGCLREKAIAADGAKDQSAGSVHEAAVAAARESRDAVTIGKTVAAHGIFLHHQGRPEEAFPLLDEALKLLPENDRYRFFVLNHIDLARKGEQCRCHAQGPQTVARMLKEAMIKEVGEGIVEDVEYSDADLKNPFSLKVSRKLTPEEQQKVADTWTNVYSAIRRQLNGENQ